LAKQPQNDRFIKVVSGYFTNSIMPTLSPAAGKPDRARYQVEGKA
jgi:hypothetical protein